MAQHLPVPFHKQIAAGYCMAACVQMVLAYQNIFRVQEEIAKQLKIKSPLGAPTRNIQRLASNEISVVYEEGTLAHLSQWLAADRPIIAFIQAGELSYWHGETFQHAVVVVGLDEKGVWLIDPDVDAEPIAVTEDEFMLPG